MRYFIDLVKDLKEGRFYPVYLLYGPESYLRREAVKRIRECLLPGGADDFNFITIDGEEKHTSEILSLAAMSPLFAGKRLVVVSNARHFSRKKGSPDSPGEEEADAPKGDEARLIKYLAGPSPDTCIVFDAGEAVDKRKKVYREISRVGRAIEFTLLKNEDLSAWLDKQARRAGKSLAPGTAAGIIDRAGNTMQALSMEINKLICYVGENKVISQKDVAAVTPPNPEEDIFAVVDALGGRNAARAIAGINRLVMQKHPPPVILGMVARQIRLLLLAGEAIRSGNTAAELAPRLGIHPYVAKKMASQQKNFNRRQLVGALIALHGLDQSVKSGKRDFLPGMEALILDTCRK
ncbi:MAG: DNA polymerase III subunit delta [Actinobacteria bacterium]|nr:DNA polymerase III subunit delta [Actinomycetota bacterium]